VLVPQDILGPAVVILAILVVLLGLVAGILAVRIGRLRRSYVAAMGDGRHENVFDVLRDQHEALERVRRDIRVIHGNTEILRDRIRASVSRVGVIRYDAFDDMGGALSFSAALLNESGDGVVISAINGRAETRAYAKPILDGDSEHHLTPEERGAIDAAMQGEADADSDGSRRRRRAVT
jgi:hypothetical protein